ncbi:serine hydrolase domain-containing protein [Streptomyces sp. H27-C3]|uniref:serine hydrolase domain-containing protein n=1 Tax=Streptomyces sp. H27-C3 TaxID=3046305 RepID=UPI0024BABCE2|nr:serine hydrolase domain-containing protein [Streptomyces sp. H27-C3]MDJ0462531.1 serine hydrolase domain-containing protein [Streptomyces sp. H27-C3]
MTIRTGPATTAFLSDSWLATTAGRLPAPDPLPRSTVAFRLTLTDPPSGITAATDVLVGLEGGRLGMTRAGGEAPGLLITLPYAAAYDLLLGPARARVEVLERGDVTVVGNFSLLFFVDAALERDREGHVAALRDGTAVPPGAVRAPDARAGRDGGRGTAAAAPPADTEAVARAAEALPRTVRELRREVGGSTPGAQFYVSLGGKTLADAGLGMARPGVAMTADSAPLWYCCAKPLLSVALGRLWERGDFDPYLPVAHYLPEFGTGGKAAITSMELLTHTAPVPTGEDPLHGVVGAPDEVRLRRAFGAVVEPRPPGAPAGINYSQWWAWFVLAQLLPVLDGRDYADYAEEEILRPCRMDRTRVYLTPDDYDAYGDRLPLIHVSNLGDTPQPGYFWSTRGATTRCIPGVNTRGPLSNLGRLLEMLLAGGAAPGGRVLSPTTVAALTGRHRTGLRDRYGNADWGFGVRLECRSLGPEFTSFSRHTSPRAFGHDGLWTATAFADPQTHLTVAVHLNGKVEHERHRERIFRITDAVHQDLGLV